MLVSIFKMLWIVSQKLLERQLVPYLPGMAKCNYRYIFLRVEAFKEFSVRNQSEVSKTLMSPLPKKAYSIKA